MIKMFIILALSNSYSLLSVIAIADFSLTAGFLIKLAKFSIAKKRILRLEDEMLANHARILKLQKKISELQNDNPSAQSGNAPLKKVEDLKRKIS